MARKVCESVEALHSPRDPAPQDARGDPNDLKQCYKKNDLKQGMSVGRDGCGLRAVAVVPNCCCGGVAVVPVPRPRMLASARIGSPPPEADRVGGAPSRAQALPRWVRET